MRLSSMYLAKYLSSVTLRSRVLGTESMAKLWLFCVPESLSSLPVGGAFDPAFSDSSMATPTPPAAKAAAATAAAAAAAASVAVALEVRYWIDLASEDSVIRQLSLKRTPTDRSDNWGKRKK